jgi:hypothetical protein
MCNYKNAKIPILIGLIIFTLSSCQVSRNVTLAYTNGKALPIGTKVQAGGKTIGFLFSYKKSVTDTLFAVLRTNRHVKIPVRSEFSIFENFFGPSRIMVVFSKSKYFLPGKDIAWGTFSPMNLTDDH